MTITDWQSANDNSRMRTKLRNISSAAAALMLPLLAHASDTQHCYLRDAASPTASGAYIGNSVSETLGKSK